MLQANLNNAQRIEREIDRFSIARQLLSPIWVYDIDRQRIVFANEQACKIWDAETEAELKLRDLSKDMSQTVASRLRQYQQDFLQTDAVFNETWTIHPNGTPIALNISYSAYPMEDGRMSMLCEVTSKSNEPSDTIRSTKALLHTEVAIILFSVDGRQLYKNPAARRALAIADMHLGSIFEDLEDLKRIRSQLKRQGECRIVSLIRTLEGARWFDLSVKKSWDSVTGDPAYLVTAFDVTELKDARDRANYLASRDQLTGCFNRSYIQKILDNKIEVTDCTVLYIDVDRFKNVNDTYGHEAGDLILRSIVSKINNHLTDKDVLARIGGDEFVVLFDLVESDTRTEQRLRNIQNDIFKPILIGQAKIEVSVSLGASRYNSSVGKAIGETFKEADLALYHAKKQGCNAFTVYEDSIGESVADRKWLETEIVLAIQNQDFDLFYQPRICLQTHQVVGVEALLRWHHASRGFISPALFVPISEEIDVIDKIGAIAFQKACSQMAIWHALGLELDVSINVSPKQFLHESFITLLEQTTARMEFPISRMELEITEGTLLGDSWDVRARINRVQELGFKIALDDFGTGYSNLAYISQFPIQCIKVDKQFTQNLPASGPLIRLIFALAHQIDALVVAEGVETPEQLRWLQDYQCEQVQGFLFGKAEPADLIPNQIQKIENLLKSIGTSTAKKRV